MAETRALVTPSPATPREPVGRAALVIGLAVAGASSPQVAPQTLTTE
jgi:hypothetical protein